MYVSRKSPQMWRKLPDFQAEKKAQDPVTSVAVMVFFGPDKPVENPQRIASVEVLGAMALPFQQEKHMRILMFSDLN